MQMSSSLANDKVGLLTIKSKYVNNEKDHWSDYFYELFYAI